MSATTLFRIHFADGTTTDVRAANPKDARAEAEKTHAAKVSKVKVVRTQ